MSSRCKGICKNGKRCKRNTTGEYCFNHDISKKCLICDRLENLPYCRNTLECGHSFCNQCVRNEKLSFGFLDYFSIYTDPVFGKSDTLHCPECKTLLSKQDTESIIHKITCYCDSKIIVDKYYIEYTCSEDQIDNNQQFEASDFDFKDVELINSIYTKEKYKWRGDWYLKRVYGDQRIRNYFKEHVFKELMEWVWHPSRIRLEDLDQF